ncbi:MULTISPECIES: Crp/Fnr family transcriptional regulator [Methylobacterium]|uniref:Crp/Fnr family transcriptional regulator n=1 Tax=Methylobacterium TaxID=407 RepID=UPI00105150C3|nr:MULTISPECIES: Crp/Fnr family transcriptional regulator [Methylobacterium]MDR7040181.1 CRP-like cAMP-binding protein [Methylobacterium sp. BE186]
MDAVLPQIPFDPARDTPAPTVRNRLLRVLPPEDLALLRGRAETVSVEAGARLANANAPMGDAFFPESGLASVSLATVEGSRLEVGITGREGMVSPAFVLGVERTPFETEVRIGGQALRVGAEALREAMARSETLRRLLMRYVQVVTLWTSQTALSNRRHKTEERLARWLLLVHDRIDGDELTLTHETLSTMLGVHRPGVTVAVHELESGGMIATKRGLITILDRDKLVRVAGTSYGFAEAEYERLIGPLRGPA